MDATPTVKDWLDNGFFVLADRYAASNAAHQGGKIKDPAERLRFLRWLNWFEFEVLKNIRPALNIILGVPAEISFEAVQKRAIKENRQLDEHEKLFDHIRAAAAVYKELTELFPDEYKLIDCMENNRWLSPENIHEKVWKLVQEKF
jgi:dTMP kinase